MNCQVFRTVLGLLIVASAGGEVAWSQSQFLPGSVSAATPPGAKTPLFVGITVRRRPISTESQNAQRYFDQGLNLTYAFNHDEAIRSFQQATRFDPKCAMAWWGIALCNGPHINNPQMDEARSLAAWEALTQALGCCDVAAPVEQSLIKALADRYVADAAVNVTDREALNQRYAEAMRRVHSSTHRMRTWPCCSPNR